MSASWIADYRTREFKRKKHAAAAQLTEADYITAVEQRLRAWVAGAEIRVRVPEAALIGILIGGRFKTWAEVGLTGSGMSDPRNRYAAEEKIFGLAQDAAPGSRPVYGYLEGSLEAWPLTQWGPIVLGLSDDLAARSTLTCGDSVDDTLTDPAFVPVPLHTPDIRAVALNRADVLAADNIGDICSAGYAEVQIHGGVPAAAITRVVYTRGHCASDEALSLLGGVGYTPIYVAGNDPGPPCMEEISAAS